MSENETQTTGNTPVSSNDTVETTEAEVTATYAAAPEVAPKESPVKGYVIAIVAVAVILLGVLYFMEKEGRSSTNIFSSVIAGQEANKVVAIVDGEEIINSELDTSIQQFSQAATAQGVDLTNPDAQAEIRTQALDVLINTELLKQAAADRGMTVTEEAAAERLETIKTDIGGEEVLAERMAALGITTEKLEADVRDEILIQQLLDIIFAEAEITVSEEEINEVYANAGGVEAGLPPIEEVRGQIEAQVKSTKEQAAIDKYLTELKADAEIVIK